MQKFYTNFGKFLKLFQKSLFTNSHKNIFWKCTFYSIESTSKELISRISFLKTHINCILYFPIAIDLDKSSHLTEDTLLPVIRVFSELLETCNTNKVFDAAKTLNSFLAEIEIYHQKYYRIHFKDISEESLDEFINLIRKFVITHQ